jgi:hypothetical protein
MKTRIRLSLAVAASCMALIAAGVVHAAGARTELPDFSPIFTKANVQGTFVLLNPQTGQTPGVRIVGKLPITASLQLSGAGASRCHAYLKPAKKRC